ncbi:hypothetical protein ACH5RR_037410 [Cinchona calisaya]|uniref:DUF4218 domain-containing protein n=1 Tax=Cinchona calisaya TaxID=153742 RepID=A0ABD2Y8B7_9GENT
MELFYHDKHQFWKKKSIFFELPYWATNLVPHNLDMMHIEGNYCDNLLSTIMGLVGNSKDNLNSRIDLEELGNRKPLHPIRKGSSLVLPPTSFTLSWVDKDIFCKKYVCNRARVEGSISKGYLTEECLKFYARYLNKNYDVEACADRPLLGKKVFLDWIPWVQAHRYILGNLDIVQPYREIHMSSLAMNYPHAKPNQIQGLHNETFHDWFKKCVKVDTRGRMRRVGKHIPMDQGHMSKNDRMPIIQGIRAEIVQEVQEEVLQEVRGETMQELREGIRTEMRVKFSMQLEYL